MEPGKRFGTDVSMAASAIVAGKRDDTYMLTPTLVPSLPSFGVPPNNYSATRAVDCRANKEKSTCMFDEEQPPVDVCQKCFTGKPQKDRLFHAYFVVALLCSIFFLAALGTAFYFYTGYNRGLISNHRNGAHELSYNRSDDFGPNSFLDSFDTRMSIRDIPKLELNKIKSMGSLLLQWGRSGSPEHKEYFFSVLSAVRDGKTNSTVLNLSSDHKFAVNKDGAILYDNNDYKVGEITFGDDEQENANSNGGNSRGGFISNNEITLSMRNLRKKEESTGRYPYNAIPGPPMSAFDSYCRYGCGSMGVTFPYYYRPFFGYGFPLVGTESLFPQGYGGYPAAPLLASQGVNPLGGVGTSIPGSNMNLMNPSPMPFAVPLV